MILLTPVIFVAINLYAALEFLDHWIFHIYRKDYWHI